MSRQDDQTVEDQGTPGPSRGGKQPVSGAKVGGNGCAAPLAAPQACGQRPDNCGIASTDVFQCPCLSHPLHRDELG